MDKCDFCTNSSSYGRHYIKDTCVFSELFCDACYNSNKYGNGKNTVDRRPSSQDNEVPDVHGVLEMDTLSCSAREA